MIFSAIRGGQNLRFRDRQLKIYPDKVVFSQYATALFKSPDYLLKFWNSVIWGAHVVFQVAIAAFAAYSFTRYRGKFKELLFFVYIVPKLMPIR